MYTSPLRYPGGKRKLSKYMKVVIEYNNLLDGEYIELYAGGASVALYLLFMEQVACVHINDLDRSVYAFWHAALNETTQLCNIIRETPVTMETWYRQKEVQERAADAPLLELGFSTFFLNRTNRSGILTGGVIGGKRQDGEWKLDARYNKEDLIQRIKKVARYRSRIHIYNEDAADFIRTRLPTLSPRSLVYLDPPYYVKGGSELYKNFYQPEDHATIAMLVSNIPQRWVVSYDNVPEILKLYHPYQHVIYELSYSATGRYKGSEIAFFCPTLALPPVSDPIRVDDEVCSQLQLGLPLEMPPNE